MNPQTLKLMELVLVFGAVLGWAVWELVSVRRSQAADRRARERAGDGEGPAAEDPGATRPPR
jgi:hypothetical protein